MAKNRSTAEEQIDTAHHAAASEPNGVNGNVKQRKKRVPVDPNETPADKFRRLLRKRGPKFVRSCMAISNLFGSKNYEWTEEQRQGLLEIINPVVAGMYDVINGKSRKQAVSFDHL